jgi:ribosomal-protein-alanine N-acetyltransferase
MNSHEFQVRVGNATDFAGVIEMERAIDEVPHWAETDYIAILGAKDGISRSIRRHLFIAEQSGRLLGFAVAKVIGLEAGGVAELESVAVKLVERRSGVGRALCESVIGWSREQGATEIDLEVRASSSAAIALYGALGFTPNGRRTGYYQSPVEDAVLMRLKFGPTSAR